MIGGFLFRGGDDYTIILSYIIVIIIVIFIIFIIVARRRSGPTRGPALPDRRAVRARRNDLFSL